MAIYTHSVIENAAKTIKPTDTVAEAQVIQRDKKKLERMHEQAIIQLALEKDHKDIIGERRHWTTYEVTTTRSMVTLSQYGADEHFGRGPARYTIRESKKNLMAKYGPRR